MIDLDQWASLAATRAASDAHDAGLSSERNYHQGRQVIYSMSLDQQTKALAAKMLRRCLKLTGARGSRFIAGMRDATAALDAVEAFISAATGEAKAEWTGESDA